jgi:hypothetical protein
MTYCIRQQPPKYSIINKFGTHFFNFNFYFTQTIFPVLSILVILLTFVSFIQSLMIFSVLDISHYIKVLVKILAFKCFYFTYSLGFLLIYIHFKELQYLTSYSF